MIALLENNPLLLLFAIAALGFLLGKITFRGVSLGVSAVLFSALFFGALSPRMRLPELLQQLGLAIFLYTMGLASGRQFFGSLRGEGLRENGFAAVSVLAMAGLVALISGLLRLDAAGGAGLFTGAFTNAASLAAVREFVREHLAGDQAQAFLNGSTVSFSLAYPLGIFITLIVIALAPRVFRIDYAAEGAHEAQGKARRLITTRNLKVTAEEAIGRSLARIMADHPLDVVVGRVRHHDEVVIATGRVVLQEGDLLTAVGSVSDLDRFQGLIGEASDEHLEWDRNELDNRRIFVSDPRLAGRALKELSLPKSIGAVVTRVRRGDNDMIASGELRLELGDRVRVIARREDIPAATRFFGDSYRSLSEVDVLTLNLGLALGILLGFVEFPIPGGLSLKLGVAGGPLLVSLILGSLGQTGPLVWGMPYNANLTLRQFGLVLFLAGVGSGAGYDLAQTLVNGNAVVLLLTASAVIVLAQVLILCVGRWLLRIPLGRLVGILAAIMTQPGLLPFVESRVGDDRPQSGYAQVYPMALIAKILIAQALTAVLMAGRF